MAKIYSEWCAHKKYHLSNEHEDAEMWSQEEIEYDKLFAHSYNPNKLNLKLRFPSVKKELRKMVEGLL